MGIKVNIDGAKEIGVEGNNEGWFIVVRFVDDVSRYGPFDMERAIKGMRKLNKIMRKRERNA